MATAKAWRGCNPIAPNHRPCRCNYGSSTAITMYWPAVPIARRPQPCSDTTNLCTFTKSPRGDIFFSGGSASAVVRLQASAPVYLLIRNPGTTGRGAVMTMIVLFIATMVGAILLGLLLLTLYLRGRSSEASKVIRDMQAGNLAARFSTDKLDAIGGLMLHFNAMANEIQRLVGRLQTIERTRRELLQELGHDLRTSLTSLRTTINTLTVHGSAMDEAERKELFTVVSSELEYFTKLIDDLFFIASIDEPSYHAQAGEFDLLALLRTETSHAQTSQTATGKQLRFELDDSATSGFNGHISGDAYLIARLFRNVYDNAARHASTCVRTRILPHGDALEIVIDDDGQGLSREALHRFGLRRDQRILASGSHAAVSLGLGSVIIKTIIELHGGSLKITNGDADSDFPGMRLHLYFPALVK